MRLVMVLVLIVLLVMAGCGETITKSSTMKTVVTVTDAQILEKHPDNIDTALQELNDADS